LDSLTDMQYGNKRPNKAALISQIQSFEDLVIRLSFIKTVPIQKAVSAKKPKKAASTLKQPEASIQPGQFPSLIERLKDKTAHILDKSKEREQPAKEKLAPPKDAGKSPAKPQPEEPEDLLGKTYELFSQAYDAVSNNDLVTSKKLAEAIRKSSQALDEDIQEQFNDELENLGQNIAQLEKGTRKKARPENQPKSEPPMAKPTKPASPSKLALGKLQEEKNLKGHQPKPTEKPLAVKPAKPRVLSPVKVSKPLADRAETLLKSQIDDLKSGVESLRAIVNDRQDELSRLLAARKEDAPSNRELALTTKVADLKSQIKSLTRTLEEKQRDFRSMLDMTMSEKKKKESVLTKQVGFLNKEVAQLTKTLESRENELKKFKTIRQEGETLSWVKPKKQLLEQKALDKIEMHKHTISKKQPAEPEMPHRIEGPTIKHLIDRFIYRKDVVIEPTPLLEKPPLPDVTEAEEMAGILSSEQKPKKKIRLVITKKKPLPEKPLPEPSLSQVTRELIREPIRQLPQPSLTMPPPPQPEARETKKSKEYLSVEELFKEIDQQSRGREQEIRREVSPVDRILDKFTRPKTQGMQQARNLSVHPPIAPISKSVGADNFSGVVEQIYEDINKESEAKLKAKKLKKLIPTITPPVLPHLPAPLDHEEIPAPILSQSPKDRDIEKLKRISCIIEEIYPKIREKNLEGTQTLWNEIEDIKLTLSDETLKDIGPDINGIETQLAELEEKAHASAFIDTQSLQVEQNYNQKIAGIVRSWKSARRIPMTTVAITKEPSPPLIKPANEPEPKKLSPKAPTLEDLDKVIQSVKGMLRTNQLKDARETYQKDISLKKRLKLAPDAKTRIDYDLMDLNVELRMAKIR
jgi:Mg2+ and Co2+ transporter CorA